MKRIQLLMFLLISGISLSQGGPECSLMEPICTNVGLDFTANAGVAEASTTDPGNDYGCLITQPNPTWYYFEISSAGDIFMNLNAPSDIDFIIWGPFSSLSEAQANCGDLGNPPANNEVDCSFSPTNDEYPVIPGAQVGEVYVMLITNYADVVQDVTLTQTGGSGATDCSIVTNPPCAMTAFDVSVTGCEFATGTYDITGTIYYTDPPLSGNLVVENCAGTPIVVATAPFGPGPVNFSINDVTADGVACTLDAYFTADPLCTQSYSYVAPLCLPNCPTYDLNASSPTIACGNQTYYLEIQNSGCDGYIEFTVVGNYGSQYANEITWQVTSNLTGNVVASGGPGTNGAPINVTVGPIDPNIQGVIYTLTVFDSFGDGFDGVGGFIQINQNGNPIMTPITTFTDEASTIFQAGITVSASTLTVMTPSGPIMSVMSNCLDHEIAIPLANNNFCTPIEVDLPWVITCNTTGDVIASGEHTVVVYPQVPDQSSDVVSITWNTTTCSWDVSPNNDCSDLDIGSIFTISPDPATINNYCADGTENFTVDYLGFPAGPDCCSTAGPSSPITYSEDDTKPEAVVASSPFGGVNNSAYQVIPANGTGGNATSLNLSVSLTGFCFNPPGLFGTDDDFWVTVYVDGVIIYDQLQAVPPTSFSQTFDLTDIPSGYNENSVVEVYVYPNSFSSGGTNTTFNPNANCGSLADGVWNLSTFDVSLDVVFDQSAPTPVNCALPAASPYTCCTITPLSANAPANTAVACPSAVPAPNIASVTGIVSDCPTTVTHVSDVPTGSCPSSIARTYRVTDACGDFIDVVQTITINPPLVTMPANGSQTVNCPAQAVLPTPPTVTDNCGRTLSVSLIGSTPPPACEGTVTYNFTYTDCQGTTYPWSYVYTISFTSAITPPANGSSTVNCPSAAVNPGAPANITDACGRTIAPVLIGQDAATPTCEGTVVWRYRYTACDGTTADWTYTYTINYTTPLVVPALGASTVSCPSSAVNPGAPANITDACGRTIAPVLIGQDAATPACEGTVVWRYRYTACDGTTADWTYTYTIDRPPFTIPYANGAATVSCPVDAIDPGAPGVVQDACGNVLTPVVTAPSLVGCSGGTMNWIYTYTDCAGNSASWTYAYTVSMVPFSIAQADGASTVSCASAALVQPVAPIVQDACGNNIVPVATAPSAIPCEGTMTWVFTYTDCANNSDTWNYVYTIDIPAFTIAAADGASTVSCVAAAQVQPAAPAVQDACGNTLTPVVTSPSAVACEGTMTWVFTYTDCAGNSDTWNYVYTVDRTTAPAQVGGPVSTSSIVSCVTSALPPAVLPVVQDQCGNVLTPTGPSVGGTYAGCEGTVTYTYNYTDCAGLPFSWTYTYTIDLPAFTIPYANGAATVSCPANATDPGAPGAVTDACGNVLTPVVTAPVVVGCNGGTMNWVYTYTDCAGNSASWTYAYTVSMAPFTIAQADGAATVSCAPAAQVQPTPPTIQDACGNNIVPVVTAPAAVACEGTMTWVFTYTDCAGNSDTWNFVYTVDVPAFTIAAADGASTVNCVAAAQVQPAAPVVQDACGNTLTPVVTTPTAIACEGNMTWVFTYTDCAGNNDTWSYVYTIDIPAFTIAAADGASTVNCIAAAQVQPVAPVVQDACGNTLTPVVTPPTAVACEGTMTWVFTFTDCAGNNDTWSYVYTVDVPAFTIPFANGSASVACPADAVDPGAPGVVQDACGNTLTPVVTAPSAVGCTGGTMDWVYTYTDCAGNIATWTYSYTVNMPAFTLPFADDASTVTCLADAQVQPVPPSAVLDQCGNTITPVVTVPADISCEGDMAWVFTYTDCAGNTLDWTYTYTVDYTGGLTIPVNGTEAVECVNDATDPGAPANVQDACGNTVVPVFVDVVTTPDPVVCAATVVYTYQYQTCDGITYDWTYTYDVNDITDPTASNPVALSFECAADVPAPDPAVITDEADNCSAPVVAWVSDVSDNGSCPEVITRTYSVTDACGNQILVSQTITIQDVTNPVGNAPADLVVPDGGSVPAPDVTSVTGVSDNCTLNPVVTWVGDVSDGGDCPEVITRTYSISDDCGNTITVSQVITVDSKCDIVIPTAFTPNGDGENDDWEIIDLDQVYPNNIVYVYNRWGNLIYTSNKGDYASKKWDGTYNEQNLPVASYYYIIFTEGDNSGEKIQGTVSIIKK